MVNTDLSAIEITVRTQPNKATSRAPINRPDTNARFPRTSEEIICVQQPVHTFGPGNEEGSLRKSNAESAPGAALSRKEDLGDDCSICRHIALLSFSGQLHKFRLTAPRSQPR